MNYSLDFEGKVVCITGGSRGFGKAVAEGIAARGGSIVIVSKDATRFFRLLEYDLTIAEEKKR